MKTNYRRTERGKTNKEHFLKLVADQIAKPNVTMVSVVLSDSDDPEACLIELLAYGYDGRAIDCPRLEKVLKAGLKSVQETIAQQQ